MKMRRPVNICNLVISALCFVSLVGCIGGKKAREAAEVTPPGESGVDRRFEPLDLPQDHEIVPLVHPQTGAIYGKEAALSSESLSNTNESSDTMKSQGAFDTLNSQVYRIQIFTSELYGEARRAMTVAEEIFDRPVFLDYEVPYFKVRVGGFAQRDEAEDYLPRAKAAGYPEAWVVVVNVAVKEPAPLYPDTTSSGIKDSVGYPENDKSDD
jgi:hypothetical protein